MESLAQMRPVFVQILLKFLSILSSFQPAVAPKLPVFGESFRGIALEENQNVLQIASESLILDPIS